MKIRLPPLDGVEIQPIGRFEWERIIRRIRMPKPLKFLALLLSTYADPDGTRVRPGVVELMEDTGDGDRHVRRLLGQLRDEYGLIQQVSRGGGRGGKGKAATYRLTIPADLLERCLVRNPGSRSKPDGSTGTPPKAETGGVSPDTQVPAQRGHATVDNPGPPGGDVVSPDIQSAGESGQSPVDSLDGGKFHRTSDATWPRLTGHLESIDRPSRGPTTTHDQPPKMTTQGLSTSATTGRARARFDRTSTQQLEAKPVKCPHGLSPARSPVGVARCPMCRRNLTQLVLPALPTGSVVLTA